MLRVKQFTTPLTSGMISYYVAALWPALWDVIDFKRSLLVTRWQIIQKVSGSSRVYERTMLSIIIICT
jgi:hypothetical protein